MNYIWDHDNVSISSVSMNRWDGSQMWTSGMGWITHFQQSTVFQWEATALSSGWYIVITSAIGKIGEFQGSTFNLPLEIASAVKRLM